MGRPKKVEEVAEKAQDAEEAINPAIKEFEELEALYLKLQELNGDLENKISIIKRDI